MGLVGPKDVNVQPEGVACCHVCQTLLHCFELEGNTFLEQIVTCDEMWVNYLIPESKQSSME
jgi:hypothetical protein